MPTVVTSPATTVSVGVSAGSSAPSVSAQAGSDEEVSVTLPFARADLSNVTGAGIVVAPEAYGAVGDGVTDDRAALVAAIAAARVAKAPLRLAAKTYAYTGTLSATDSASGANDFGGIIGQGAERSVLLCLTDNVHALEFAGQYKIFDGFTVRFANLQAETSTSAITTYCTGLTSFCTFRNLTARNGYRNADAAAQGIFSCTVDNVRFKDAFDDNILWNRSLSTGNSIKNIYTSAQGRDRVNRLLSLFGFAQSDVGQINCEHANVQLSALRLNVSSDITIDAVNFEGIRALNPSTFAGLIETSADKPTLRGVVANYTYLGGYKITSITRSGSTATVTLDGMNGEAFTHGGHGYRTGETVYIDGPNESEYTGAQVLTDYTASTFNFTVSGTPATPSTPASGNDYSVCWGGSNSSPSYPLVNFQGQAEGLDLASLHQRGPWKIGKSSGQRASLVRWAKNTNCAGVLRVGDIRRLGRYGGWWERDNPVIALSRTSNVATFYFRWPHGLVVGSRFKTTNCTSGFSAIQTVASVASRTAVTVALSGTDQALTAQASNANAIYCAGASTKRQRTSNVARVYSATDWGVAVGVTLRLHHDAGPYTDTETQVSAVGSDGNGYYFEYMNAATDEALTTDTTFAVQPIENAMASSGSLQTPSTDFQCVAEIGDYWRPRFAFAATAIAAGAQTAVATITLIGARPGDHVMTTFDTLLIAGIEAQALVSAADTVSLYLTNNTAGSITVPASTPIMGRLDLVRI